MHVNIRELQKEDLVRGSGFYETLEHLSDVGELSEKNAREVFDTIIGQGSRIFVAVAEDGQICGTTTIMIEQKISHSGGKCGHIEDVATRKGYERKGIGKQVVAHAMEYAKRQGCYKIILDCAEKNVPFYEKLGFGRYENCMRWPPKKQTQ